MANIQMIKEQAKDESWGSRLYSCFRCHEKIEDPYVYVIERNHYCEECAKVWLERQKKINREVYK